MKQLYLMFIAWAVVSTAFAQTPASAGLPQAWADKLAPLLEKACDCTHLRQDANRYPVFEQCMEPLGNELSQLEQEALLVDRNLPQALRRRFEAEFQACDLLQRPGNMTAEDRAALRNAFHQEFLQRLTKEDPLVVAEDVARTICACKQPQDKPGELPCADRMEIMTALFDQQFRDNEALSPQINERTQPILQGCQ